MAIPNPQSRERNLTVLSSSRKIQREVVYRVHGTFVLVSVIVGVLRDPSLPLGMTSKAAERS